MMKITKGKVLVLVILIMFGITLNLVKTNQAYKRFILEDMEQSIKKSNKYFDSIRSTINIILKNDEEIQVGYDDVNDLITMHKTISRELFYLIKKYHKLDDKYDGSFFELYDNFEEKRYIAAEYYESLDKRLKKELDKETDEELNKSTYIILGDDDVSELKSILSFYNDIIKELNKLLKYHIKI
ncbi:hypothetical protein R9X47_25800 [Wukongibacter baidiensis]|uniref:hypothetical protein n=1 Tax=Wukongibacter baidiensis TaxID=1723361 RepID=UPI003D7F1FDF